VPQQRGSHRPASQRVAAAVSLLTVALAAALLLIGVVVHIAAVLVALACLLICVTAGWYAVSRRGVIRAAGLAVMAVAVGGLAASLVFADLNLLALLAVIAASVASVVSARHALRRPPRRRHPAARAAHPVLIMNLTSGGGKAERFRLAEECAKRGIEPVILHPGDDLRQLAQDAVANGADVIGMAGGDGSQALVATVASASGVPHVCVPAGTRNHFALDLGLDTDDVVSALDAFTGGVDRRVDLAAVNGRVFVNNASLGLYAKVVRSPQYREAKLATAAALLPDLLGPDARPLDLRYRGPDAEHPTAHLILVSNDPYQLDYLGGLGTRERLDLGVLGIAAARIDGPGQARRFVALEAAGEVRRFSGWQEWNAPRFEVRSGGPVEIGIDGESMVMDPPLVFESLPGALTVRLHGHAARPSPAVRAVRLLSGSTLTQLAEVAAGR